LSTSTIGATQNRIILPYPHAGQQAVRLRAKQRNWAACGRRWRKTTMGMSIVVEAMLQGGQYIWGAPTFDQVRTCWQEMYKAAGSNFTFNQGRMEAYHRKSVTYFRSLDDPDNVRSKTADGVTIDEIGDVNPLAWYEVLQPMLMDTHGWFWGFGTPKGHNWFYHEFVRALGREDSMAVQAPTLGVLIENGKLIRQPHPLENPYIDFQEVVRLYESMPEYAFRQEILAEFTQKAGVIFDHAWWEHGSNRYAIEDTAIRNTVIARWLSFDTALKDKDSSAYTACVVGELTPDYKMVIREVWRDRLTFPYLPQKIMDMATRYNQDGKLRGVIIEDKASGTSAHQTLDSTAPDWLRALLIPFMPSGDKRQRAEQAAVWARNGSILLPHPSDKAQWLFTFEDELYSSPESEYMDQVDAFAQLIIYTEHLLASGWRARNGVAA
jgi:predicted phage terminase large subunit-like protein